MSVKTISMHKVKSKRSADVFVMAGGEIDCVDKDGNTPLHIAARYGHELLINTLITSGADCTRCVCVCAFYNQRLILFIYYKVSLTFSLSLEEEFMGCFPCTWQL